MKKYIYAGFKALTMQKTANNFTGLAGATKQLPSSVSLPEIDLTDFEPVEVEQTPQGFTARSISWMTGHPTVIKAGAILTGAMVTAVAPVAAATNMSVDIDWSGIGGIFSGLGTYVFPAIVTMIIGIIPALIVLAIVAFIIKFLDQILELLNIGKLMGK